MSVEHIEIDKIDKAETAEILFLKLERFLHAIGVIFVDTSVIRNAAGSENIIYLADGYDIEARSFQAVEHCLPCRFERKIMPAGGSVKVRVFAFERTGYNSADGKFAFEHTAGCAADIIEFFERNYILVGGYLKDAVRGGIDDEVPGLHMLPAVVENDLRARIGLVAEHAASCKARKLVDSILREAVRESRHRLFGHNSGYLPMTCSCILSGRTLGGSAECAARRLNCAFWRDSVDIEKAEGAHIRHVKIFGAADRAEGIASAVIVFRGIGKLADTEGIEDYKKNSLCFQKYHSV